MSVYYYQFKLLSLMMFFLHNYIFWFKQRALVVNCPVRDD